MTDKKWSWDMYVLLGLFFIIGVLVGLKFTCGFAYDSCRNQCNKFIVENYEESEVDVYGIPDIVNPRAEGLEWDEHGIPLNSSGGSE